MKKLAGWVLAMAALILVSYRSFDNLDAVVTAIRSGNVNQLSSFFDSRVEISLPDKADTYSRAQAEMVLSDFFNTNGVMNFKIAQQGESGGNSYCTGTLLTRSGNFRTTMFFRQKGDRHILQEIRFQAVD
jgi:malate synthase